MALLELVGGEILDNLAVNGRTVVKVTVSINRRNTFRDVALAESRLSRILKVFFGETSKTCEAITT